MHLSEDGEHALREAQQFCWKSNIAIVSAEHLLCGALLAMVNGGAQGLPAEDALAAALLVVQGRGDTPLTTNVMYGSAARDAINRTAGMVREAGGARIDARTLALGTIDSGEVNPMLYSELGVAKADLRAAVETVPA